MASILNQFLQHGLAGLLVGVLQVTLRRCKYPRLTLWEGFINSIVTLLVYQALCAIFS